MTVVTNGAVFGKLVGDWADFVVFQSSRWPPFGSCRSLPVESRIVPNRYDPGPESHYRGEIEGRGRISAVVPVKCRGVEKPAEMPSVTDDVRRAKSDEERRSQNQNERRRDHQTRDDGEAVQCVDCALAPKHGSNSRRLGETPQSHALKIGPRVPNQCDGRHKVGGLLKKYARFGPAGAGDRRNRGDLE